MPEPAVPGLTLLDSPNLIVGYTIQGQTLNLDGTQGVASLWLENSHLVNDTINAAGTTVINSYLDSTVSGTINVGTAAGPGDLQNEVIPTDTAGVGPSDHNPVITYDANVAVNQGSEFNVQAGMAGTVAGFINNGTITAAPGGTGADGGADTFVLNGRGGEHLEHGGQLLPWRRGDDLRLHGRGQHAAVDGAGRGGGLSGRPTIHSELAGAGTEVNASVTFAGVSLADALGKFSVTTGVVGGTPYLNVAYTG